MILIKLDKEWLQEIKDTILDNFYNGYSNPEDFKNGDLTLFVDNLKKYSSDRKEYYCFDVKNMGYADFDEINKAFKNFGYDEMDAYDYVDFISESCQFDDTVIFEDIENFMDVPFYAIGRMGGHWGVTVEDALDYHHNLFDIEFDEKTIFSFLNSNEEYADIEDVWDIYPSEVADYILDNANEMIEIVWDENFIKHLNNAWKEIKQQSDYMLTYDYAEEIAQQIIDNFVD